MLEQWQADGPDEADKQCRLSFKVRATLDLSARHKLMTVIVEDKQHGLHLYCKFADPKVLSLCRADSAEIQAVVLSTNRRATSFARDGLRAPVMAGAAWRTPSGRSSRWRTAWPRWLWRAGSSNRASPTRQAAFDASYNSTNCWRWRM